MKRESVVTVYVRHQGGCKFEGKNFARGCTCPKWLRWSADGKQHRVATGTRSWEKAEEMRADREEVLRSGGTVATAQERVTLPAALKLFLVEKNTEGITTGVYKKYEREIQRFVDFCADLGKHFPSDVDKLILLEYKALWEEVYPSSATRASVQTRLRNFLRFLNEAGWLESIPKMKAVKIDVPPTMPLSKDQYAVLCSTVGKIYTEDKAARVHALIQLMRFSGLAISDAVNFDRSKMAQAEGIWLITTARQKTGNHVCVPIPAAIAEEVLAAPAFNVHSVTVWHDFLQKLFQAAFGKDTTFTPHSLRDTAAVEWLAAGIPLEEVSKLLGHSSVKTTEKHYAPWVKARQDRLISLVTATWGRSVP